MSAAWHDHNIYLTRERAERELAGHLNDNEDWRIIERPVGRGVDYVVQYRRRQRRTRAEHSRRAR